MWLGCKDRIRHVYATYAAFICRKLLLRIVFRIGLSTDPATLPEFLDQLITDIVRIGVDLTGQVVGHFVQHKVRASIVPPAHVMPSNKLDFRRCWRSASQAMLRAIDQ